MPKILNIGFRKTQNIVLLHPVIVKTSKRGARKKGIVTTLINVTDYSDCSKKLDWRLLECRI
jgi:hypothetical protein